MFLNYLFVESVFVDSLVSGAEAQKLGRGVKVELLTDDTVKNHSIYDIVLPLPGFDVTFPSYGGASWYEEILAGDNLTLSMLHHRIK
jgi:tRNA pseudouridine13 synthase